ncbi:ABC transporter ATP-binding protein [Janibacter endophyticus]|uniref:ABC transporter ATP-binding protein n=1 Tax=Janibacter endophyticus TaxID=2806261 RepID=UPI001F388401|nr:ABC transporter ATP-binding protein [Janibacter endophyticus]
MSTTTTQVPQGSPADTGEVVLEAKDIVMRFGGLTAVNNVSFQVHEGEILGLIGPNGAGKTTFFNCLTGMYKPTSGTVRLGGNVLPPKPREVVTAGMARTFQNIRLFNNMTALENVMVGRYCRTSSMALTSILRGPKFRREESESLERAHRLLDFVGLDHKADSLARNLPYGEQRKLEIARALATDPQVILLDEPTAGMNPKETEEAMHLIFRIRDLGMAVVVIEHDMRFIFNLCDRVLCLVRGETLIEGTPGEVQSDPRVIEAYIGGADDDISDDELTAEDVEVLHAEGIEIDAPGTDGTEAR